MTNQLCHVTRVRAIPELHACNSGATSRVACMQLWNGLQSSMYATLERDVEIEIAKILHASLLEIWQ